MTSIVTLCNKSDVIETPLLRLALLCLFLSVFLREGVCSALALEVPSIVGDHMVLQRDRPLAIWGWAEPGAEVEVRFADSQSSAVAGTDGRWEVVLPPSPASESGRVLTIRRGDDVRRFSDVVVGDVWILAGQSNMGWSVDQSSGGAEAKARAAYPWLRGFLQWPMQGASEKEERDVKGGGWRVASPETVGGFSGVGFFFAEALREPGVPIGLVHTPMGGTAIETWLPAEVVRTLPEAGVGAEFFRRKVAEHEAALGNWGEATEEWKKVADQARAEGHPVPEAPPEPKGVARHNLPSALFNGKVRPLQPFAARGVLWYQGESNATDTETSCRYGPMLEALITSWRRGWRDESLPFVVIQLPGYENPNNPTGPDWPGLRAQQADVVTRMAHTHLVVALDLGERGNIHPADKASVGERAARVVRRQVFGDDRVASDGPRFAAAARDGQDIILRFRTTGALEAGPGLLPGDWQVSGADGKWRDAPVAITASEVRLRIPDAVQEPLRVRYAWQNWTAGAVRDASGLPLEPFEATLGSM